MRYHPGQYKIVMRFPVAGVYTDPKIRVEITIENTRYAGKQMFTSPTMREALKKAADWTDSN